MINKPTRCSCTMAFAAPIILLIASPTVVAAVDCKPGFVPRLVSQKDEVCVPPATRLRTVSENSRAPLLWTPGAFGPKTCIQGYVWRAALPEDLVCVSSSLRSETEQDNVLAPTRRK